MKIGRKRKRLLWWVGTHYMNSRSNYTVAFDTIYGLMVSRSRQKFWEVLHQTILGRRPGMNEYMELEWAPSCVRKMSHLCRPL